MSRILPSQAVSAIEALFPDLIKPRKSAASAPTLQYSSARDVAAALAVLAEVPNALIALGGAELAELVIARTRASAFVDACSRPQERGDGVVAGAIARMASGQTLDGDCILTILSLLQSCPDQIVPASTVELAFVDPALRESLRVDIAEVDRALTDSEWKSATVVCGSVIEALLLWRLSQDAPAALASASRLKAAGTVSSAKPALEDWDLHHYIEVAAEMGIIRSDDTATQLRLAKDFRNLIHPGRAIRLARKCDRPTALAASAGLGFLIRDLTP